MRSRAGVCGLAGLGVALMMTGAFAEETVSRTELPDGCVVERFEIQSASMNRGIPVTVLIPPVSSGTKLPVLYALHGRDAAHTSFSEMEPLQKFLVGHPMLVVAFQADQDSAYVDATVRENSLFTTFFFSELMPEVSRRYATDGRQAVTGFSMGGYGAFHYLLCEPELFNSASSASGAMELFNPDESREGRREWLSSLIGPADTNRSAYESLDVARRLETAVKSGVKLPPILMVCGSSDFLLKSNREFVDFVGRLNQEVIETELPGLDAMEPRAKRDEVARFQRERLVDFEYREHPGAHDWPYWRDVFDDIAEFHWRCFQQKKEP